LDLVDNTRHFPTPVCARKVPERDALGKREGKIDRSLPSLRGAKRRSNPSGFEAIQFADAWIASLALAMTTLSVLYSQKRKGPKPLSSRGYH
jgi:hypothetical protein